MPPSLNSYESLVLKSALASRFLLLSLVVLWRSLVDPYDTSATLNPNCLSSTPPSSSAEKLVLWPSLGSAIESNIVWDSVYYVRIAQCGYEYEQTYAFFPLLPFLISVSSRTVLLPLVPVIGYRAVLGLSGYVISNIAFVLAAVYFYRLSVIILKDTKASLRASILFCFNPASIFYTSIYSESLYAVFSIGGVYHWFSGAQSIAVLWLAVSGLARSNGMLNAGYICFHTMLRAYEALIYQKRTSLAMRVVAVGILRCLFIFVPFISFQAFGYYNICHRQHFDEIRPWCRGRIPAMYNYIQGHYWGVGFLKYFQLKEIPNFLLASPILTLTLCSILTYARTWSKLLFSLGFQASLEEMSAEFLLRPVAYYSGAKTCSPDNMSSTDTETRHLRRRKQMIGRAKPSTQAKENELLDESPYLSASVFPFIVHLGFMGATALFVMHVQVATRFLSASAPLYWFAAYLMISPSSRRWGYLIWAYCAAYILLGSLLFSNFYPFT